MSIFFPLTPSFTPRETTSVYTQNQSDTIMTVEDGSSLAGISHQVSILHTSGRWEHVVDVRFDTRRTGSLHPSQ